MSEYKSNPQIVAEILGREGFYTLTTSDGCLCAHICLRGINIDVHCWKSEHNGCGCRWASVHLTPTDPENKEELRKVGEIVRTEMERPDMNVRVIVHEPLHAYNYAGSGHEDLVFDAPTPDGGFQFGYPSNTISPTSPMSSC